MPVSGKCNEEITLTESDKIKDAIQGLPPDVAYGRLLKETAGFATLLLFNTQADYQFPYIATVSNTGKVIDKKELYSVNCAEDANYFGTAAYIISKDLIIIQTDSTAAYERNANGEIIKESSKSESRKSRFYIDEEGKIKPCKN